MNDSRCQHEWKYTWLIIFCFNCITALSEFVSLQTTECIPWLGQKWCLFLPEDEWLLMQDVHRQATAQCVASTAVITSDMYSCKTWVQMYYLFLQSLSLVCRQQGITGFPLGQNRQKNADTQTPMQWFTAQEDRWRVDRCVYYVFSYYFPPSTVPTPPWVTRSGYVD